MDEIIELIFEIIFDIGVEAAHDNKVPKWLRYILMTIFYIAFAFINIVLILVGFTSLKTEPLLGTLLIAVALFFIIGFYFKYRSEKNKSKSKKLKDEE